MAIINRCCFWNNVRSGSFAAGFYTLILYTVIVTAGVFHLDIIKETLGMLIVSLITLVVSGFCVVACILMLIGLCVDSRMLLVPWLSLVLFTTLLDLLVSLILAIDAMFNPFMAILFAIDSVILGLNAYSLVCVYSQYQEYCDGRGNVQGRGNRQLPPIEYAGGRGFRDACNTVTDVGTTTNTQTSVPTGYSDVTEESPTMYKNLEDINKADKEDHQRMTLGIESQSQSSSHHSSLTHLTAEEIQ